MSEHLSFYDWASTPPMGWNSWDCFGTAVNEEQVLANADYMAKHLLRYGWNLITVDIEWFMPNPTGWDYREGIEPYMDAYGRPLPDPVRFPSAQGGAGFEPLAKKLHAKGLRLGLHLLRGILRKAVAKDVPIFGADIPASAIANRESVCPWNPTMYGVDTSHPGAQAYYDSLFAQLADWGVDFVKVDDLSRPYYQDEALAIRKAIDKTGREIVFSTSPGETPLDAGPHISKTANMWRISDDFWDDWNLLVPQFERLHKWTPFRGPGHWPDADMLPLGGIRQLSKDAWTRFTPDEQVTMMTLWSIARSPLILGGHLPKNDDFTLSLLTNEEVLAVNQLSADNRQLWRRDPQIAWTATDPDQSTYLALFNIGLEPAEVSVDPAELGIPAPVQVRDVWKREWVGSSEKAIRATIAPHGARLFRLPPVS